MNAPDETWHPKLTDAQRRVFDSKENLMVFNSRGGYGLMFRIMQIVHEAAKGGKVLMITRRSPEKVSELFTNAGFKCIADGNKIISREGWEFTVKQQS